VLARSVLCCALPVCPLQNHGLACRMCAPLLARLVRCFARMSVAKSRPCMPDVCTSGSKCVDKAWAWAKSQRPRANLALCSSCPASANSEHITHASSFITCVSHFAGHVLAHHALSRGLFVFGRRLPPGCSVNTTTVFPTVLPPPPNHPPGSSVDLRR